MKYKIDLMYNYLHIIRKTSLFCDFSFKKKME